MNSISLKRQVLKRYFVVLAFFLIQGFEIEKIVWPRKFYTRFGLFFTQAKPDILFFGKREDEFIL